MKHLTLLLMVCVALAGCQQPAPIVVVPPPTLQPTVPPTAAPIRVYVSGAVQAPGVYMLPPHSLANEALKAAGGAATEADLERVNLAQELRDQQQIHIPRKGDAAQPATLNVIASSAAASAALVNINTATTADLDKLPKIGPAVAQRIVDYRAKHGPFKKVEDLKNVSGIGDVTFEAFKDLITVEP